MNAFTKRCQDYYLMNYGDEILPSNLKFCFAFYFSDATLSSMVLSQAESSRKRKMLTDDDGSTGLTQFFS